MITKQDDHDEEKRILKESVTSLYAIEDNLRRTRATVHPAVFEAMIKNVTDRLGVLAARE